mgnify:CR=1 FL=1
MKKSLSRLKVVGIFIGIIQLIALAFCGTIVYFNLFNINSYITKEVLSPVVAAVIFIDIIYAWATLAHFSRFRQKTDLKVAELIGEDVEEAYNFGMLGLAVVDESNRVLWVNTLFKERAIEILDENILEWQPELAKLHETSSGEVVKILVNNRNYDVKLLKDAGLYIFKDTTDIETITTYSKRQSTVIGQIIIDNFSDVSGKGEETNDILSKVRSAIYEYTKENNVLLRKINNDAYLIVCNYESLEKMMENKFSLLDKVHEIGAQESTPPTLSIGIAYNYPDVIKLNDMAVSAIEIATSRGGDQVVISEYGQDLTFFGGRSEAQEQHNKVKVRVMGDAVISLLKTSTQVIIMGHEMSDMDSLGACVGVKAICDAVGTPASIIYNPKSIERKTKGALLATFSKEEMNKVFVSEAEGLDLLKGNALVVVCDVHKAEMTSAPKIIEKANKVMVIDHHRRGEDFIESPIFSDIDSAASSTSEMIAELIKYSTENPRILIPAPYATLMLAGIFMDSNFFKATSCGARTFEAAMFLKECGADNAKADDFLKDEFEEHALINKILANTKTPYYGIVYCKADEEDIIEAATLAKVGNQCMNMKGINASFIIGKTQSNEVRISCRSDGSVNVQLLAEKMGGGGHFTQAAVAFKSMKLDEVEEKLLTTLNDYLNDARTTNKGA